jgi:hypothetical protein
VGRDAEVESFVRLTRWPFLSGRARSHRRIVVVLPFEGQLLT